MKKWHVAYNVIAILVGLFYVLNALSFFFMMGPRLEPGTYDIMFKITIAGILIAVLLITGSILTGSAGRFSGVGAWLTILGYVICLPLIPLAIWGAVAYFKTRTSRDPGDGS